MISSHLQSLFAGAVALLALLLGSAACTDGADDSSGQTTGGTGGGGGAPCGDGVCAGGETCASCAEDCGSCVECPAEPPPGKYVDAVAGDDMNDGSPAHPWRTLTHAVGQLGPGDTLYLRAGTYFEMDVEIRLSGTAEEPITIQGYPCETAIVDAGWPAFRTAGNDDWELLDATIGEWRSTQAYPSSYSPEQVTGYLIDVPGYGNERVALVAYSTIENFRAESETHAPSDTDATPMYVGPGVFRDEATGRIHIRLHNSAAAIPAEEDPRQTPMYLSTAEAVLDVRESQHLVIRDVVLQNAYRPLRIAGNATDILVDGITTWGLNGIYIHNLGNARIVITDSKIYSDFPDWIYWSDVKRPPDAAARHETTSINVKEDATDIEARRNHVRGGFDGLSISDQVTRVHFHHNLVESFHDDAFELDADDVDVHVHDNFIRDSYVGVAASPSIIGPLYVYRNVMALFGAIRFRRPNINLYDSTEELGIGHCFKFATCCDLGDPRNVKVYQNTLVHVGGVSRGVAHVNHLVPDDHVAFNNIAWVANGEIAGNWGDPSLGQQIDGNLYFKANLTDTDIRFRNIWESADFATLDELRASDIFVASKVSYAPGWEANGVEGDPRFRSYTPVWDTSQVEWVVTPESLIWPVDAFEVMEDSPARGAGVVLPASLPDSRSAPAGQKPDIGAIPYGESLAVGPIR